VQGKAQLQINIYETPAMILLVLALVANAVGQNVGIGTTTPTASLMISIATNPQFQIRQTNVKDFARIRLQTGATRFFDIAALNGASARLASV
jgi:hypothetical protein